jgi:hypothetical protein
MKRILATTAAALSLIGVTATSSAPAAAAAPVEASPATRTVITTDFTVDPSGDPDDAYDLVAAKSMGILRIVLDKPKPASIVALQKLGLYAVTPETIATADAVVVLGSPSNAATYYRAGQRVVLFAGDYTGQPEYNQQLDPAAYDYLRAQRNTYWVPCFQGGLWAKGPNASYVQTTDDFLTNGTPARAWLQAAFPDRWGVRNLWAGPLIQFAWLDSWGGNGFDASRTFHGGADFVSDMTGGTRWLVANS